MGRGGGGGRDGYSLGPLRGRGGGRAGDGDSLALQMGAGGRWCVGSRQRNRCFGRPSYQLAKDSQPSGSMAFIPNEHKMLRVSLRDNTILIPVFWDGQGVKRHL